MRVDPVGTAIAAAFVGIEHAACAIARYPPNGGGYADTNQAPVAAG